MSHLYRMYAYLEVDAPLQESEHDFWRDVLNRCTESPSDVLEGNETGHSETVDVYRRDGKTQFACEIELTLCCGYSHEEYAADFRRALHFLTKDVVPDFRVSLNCYYLEYEADLAVEYSREELAA